MENCQEHDPDTATELVWAYELEPNQSGQFWCVLGEHYVVVEKDMLWAALLLLLTYPTAVAV